MIHLKKITTLLYSITVALYFLFAPNKAGIDPEIWYELYYSSHAFMIISLMSCFIYSPKLVKWDKYYLWMGIIVTCISEMWFQLSPVFNQVDREEMTRVLGLFLLAIILFVSLSSLFFKDESI